MIFMETQKILEDLISIDSQWDKSNLEIIEYIANQLKQFEIKRFDFEKNGVLFTNLIVRVPGERCDNPICFLGHTDTVRSSDEWTKGPFKPEVSLGNLYGLGASDMKAGLACMISAALNLGKRPSQDVYLLFDFDEEGGGIGGRELIKNFNLKKGRMIVAEPSSRRVIYANRGCLDVEINFSGRQGHSGYVDSDYCARNSAVHKAIVVSSKLLVYSRMIETRNNSLLGKPTLNIGKINGGTDANVVAGQASVSICRRVIPEEDINTEYERIKKIVYNVDPEAEVKSTFWVPAFNGKKDGNLSQEIQSAGIGIMNRLEYGVKPSTTEAGLFPNLDTLVFGPGTTDINHKPDEYVSILDLRDFTEIYRRLMEL